MKNEPIPIEWMKLDLKMATSHAEWMAVQAVLKRSNGHIGRRKKHSSKYKHMVPKHLTVISLNKGHLRISRPCDNCIRMMLVYGVETVTWSTGNPECPYMTEKVKNMKFHGPSRGDL